MPTIRDRVLNRVEAWSGVNDFRSSDPLENIWARSSSSSSIPFKPQAVSDLIDQLDAEFDRADPDTRDLSSWTPAKFAPTSGIKTVDELVTAVFVMPPNLVVRSLTAAFMPDEATVSLLANAVADQLIARGFPQQATKRGERNTRAKKKKPAKRGSR